MFVLDCSDRNSVLQSLATGFNCSVQRLNEVLKSLILEHVYEADPSIVVDAGEYLYNYVCEHLGLPSHVSSVIWFHGTRTFQGNTFAGGLLSLGESERIVMDMVVKLAPDQLTRDNLQQWNYHAGVPDSLFQERTLNKLHWGPYGHLIRETHFHASKLYQHDYCRLPELIEDVCNAYQDNYGQDLAGHYLQVLQPCIVWFTSEANNEKDCVEAALSYAYTSVRGDPPDTMSIYGTDGHGVSIPPDRIVKVEFLSDLSCFAGIR